MNETLGTDRKSRMILKNEKDFLGLLCPLTTPRWQNIEREEMSWQLCNLFPLFPFHIQVSNNLANCSCSCLICDVALVNKLCHRRHFVCTHSPYDVLCDSHIHPQSYLRFLRNVLLDTSETQWKVLRAYCIKAVHQYERSNSHPFTNGFDN
jgi:hypothetical protein